MRRKLLMCILMSMLLLNSLAFAERETTIFDEMSNESTTVYDQSGNQWTLYQDNTLYRGDLDRTINLTGNILFEMKRTVSVKDIELIDVKITDIAPMDNGFVVAGLAIQDRMDDNIYGTDLSKLVGVPYVFLYYFEASTPGKLGRSGLAVLLEMHDLYGFPYNTEKIKDSPYDDSYFEEYNWSDSLIQPRVIRRGSSYTDFWLLSQSRWDMGATANAKFKATEDPFMVISSIGFERTKDTSVFGHSLEWSGSHEVYVYPYLYENSAKNEWMPEKYKQEYCFTPNTTYLQEIKDSKDHIGIINMYDDETGIAYEFDLSEHGRPKYITTLWK